MSDAAVAWAYLTRVYGKFAVTVAEYIAANTCIELKNSGAYGKNLEPRWVNAEYPMNVESDIQAIGQGWQWLREGLITIQQLFSKPDKMAECSEEIARFMATPYP
eukprot:4115914-Pyramimonas_sp.AAC.1